MPNPITTHYIQFQWNSESTTISNNIMFTHWKTLQQNAFDSVLAQGGTSSPSISSFLNFNAAFKQHYPYLQRQPSDSPQDPSSLATQQEFMSLPTSIGQALKNDKLATDQEKLNDVINSRRWVNKRNSCIWLFFFCLVIQCVQFGSLDCLEIHFLWNSRGRRVY